MSSVLHPPATPNGLALSDDGVLSMALMDRVVGVDVEAKQVRGPSQWWRFQSAANRVE